MGVQNGLRISNAPTPVIPTASVTAIPPTPEYFATPISYGNPLQVMQQPAIYFYTAACCSVQRQKRFQEALEAEVHLFLIEPDGTDSAQKERQDSDAGATSGHVSTAPGFDNEKKVDHAALVIEVSCTLVGDCPSTDKERCSCSPTHIRSSRSKHRAPTGSLSSWPSGYPRHTANQGSMRWPCGTRLHHSRLQADGDKLL